MSGSPPPEHPAEFPQIAGRRRKRSETPPPTAVASSSLTVTSPPTPLEQSSQAPIAHGRGGQFSDVPPQLGQHTTTYPPPPVTYGAGSSFGVTAGGSEDNIYSSEQISPRATRKTKAHVASACINCKKKHLRCDNARPCRRCVQSGKEDTCVDVEHKKRGRPPLKPDDPSSRRSFETALSPRSGHPSDTGRGISALDQSSYPPSSIYPRTFRPLQALPPYDPTRSQYRPGPASQIYAPPSISPSPAMATGSFISSTRPYSMGQLATTLPPSPYEPSISSGPRAMTPYSTNYGYAPAPPGHMGPPPPQAYSNPIFPRTTLPPPPSPADPGLGIMGASSLQLPPIRPVSQGNPIDPTMAQQLRRESSQTSPEARRTDVGTTRQPDPKRPKMDIQGILGPRSD